MKKIFLLISISIMANIGTLQASSLIMAEKISTDNIMTITKNTLNDNIWFKEMSYEMMSGDKSNMARFTNTIWWDNTSGQILLDLGSRFNIQDVAIQVENDDTYKLDYSIDNNNWSSLFIISPEDGEVSYGMDTMSSDALSTEYIDSMDFSTVEARYLRLSASGYNSSYLVSELQVFGTLTDTLDSSFILDANAVSAVPAPPSLMLFSAGLALLAGLQYRRKKLTAKA